MATVRTKNLKLRRTTMVKMDGKQCKDLQEARDSCKAMIEHCKIHMAAIDKELAEDPEDGAEKSATIVFKSPAIKGLAARFEGIARDAQLAKAIEEELENHQGAAEKLALAFEPPDVKNAILDARRRQRRLQGAKRKVEYFRVTPIEV
jgi:hypothetical protein